MTTWGMTNRGRKLRNDSYYRGAAAPTNFYLALCAKKSEKSVNASGAVDKGSGKVGIPVTSHGYATGARIRIEGSTHYTGFFLVDATSSTNEVVIVATYSAETFTGAEKIHEAPGPDTNTLSDLVEIPAGNGYTTGGISVARNSTDFDTLTEDDTNDKSVLQLKNETWTASGGNLPSSGYATYAVLITDEATVANRQVVNFWYLGGDRVVSDTQQLVLQDLELDDVDA